MGFFLHVPFPAPEVVTVLPNHDRLLPQLLQYDPVGVETETELENFARYLVAEHRGADRGIMEATNGQFVFTARGRKTRIGNFPVGIDIAQFGRLARRFFFSSRRRHTICLSDWSSDVCSSD